MKSEKHFVTHDPFWENTLEWYGWVVQRQQHPCWKSSYDYILKKHDVLPVYHREDGPAKIYRKLTGELVKEEYYLLGRRVFKKDFETPGFIDAFILEHS